MKVIVAGAGISGLVATRELIRQGHEVTLLEPRPRLGGRILTVFSSQHGFAIDLGPEFVHGHAPETVSLVEDPGRQIKPITESQKIFWHGHTSEAEDFTDHDRFLKSVRRDGPDESAAAVINRMQLTPRRRALLENYIEGFNAADVHSLSARVYATENESVAEEMQESSHLMPGYSSLVDRLHREIRAADIRLSTRAVRVYWRRGQVDVETESSTTPNAAPDTTRTLSAQAFLSTIPVNFYTLPPGDAGAIEFTPEIDAKRAAARQIILGHVHKHVLLFKRPLWKPNGSDMEFIVAPECTFGARWLWGWQQPFTVTSWSGGRKAFALAQRSDEEILDVSLRDLSLVTGVALPEIREAIDEVHSHNWLADPWSRGAYSYVQVGARAVREQLFEPIEETLFFAGEGTMHDGSAATVHGAIRSALRAVQAFKK